MSLGSSEIQDLLKISPGDGERELGKRLDSYDISLLFREFFIYNPKESFQVMYGVRREETGSKEGCFTGADENLVRH